MKYSLFIIFFLISFLGLSQDVYTKDNVNIGSRKDMIKACASGAKKEMVKLKGIEVDIEQYCACVCDEIIPTLSSTEILKAYEKGDMENLFLKEENFDKIMKCAESNFSFGDETEIDMVDKSPKSKNLVVKVCVDGIMKEDIPGIDWTEKQATDYCQCALDKLLGNGYTYKEMIQIKDPSSKLFNEVALPCLNDVFSGKGYQPEKDSIEVEEDVTIEMVMFDDADSVNITGDKTTSEIKMIRYLQQGFKLKLEIDGLEKYFLLDTGASDLIINKETEKELLKRKSITKDDYCGTENYIMANGESVNAKLVWLKNIKIGDYTVSRVKAAIIDEGMLCGVSFLNLFDKWNIDGKNGILILTK